MLGNTGSGYCKRAEEYGHYDANPEINKRTRFFAAAAAVSQVLAGGDTPPGIALGVEERFISTETKAFLSGVGETLQSLNRGVVKTILDGGRLMFSGPDPTGPDLDKFMVHLEQTTVQGMLDTLKAKNPDAYNKVIKDNNALLNPAGLMKDASSVFKTDAAFGKILDAVRKDLGRNIDFARQSDREAIGLKLVNHIRKTGGCDVGGDKISGCE